MKLQNWNLFEFQKLNDKQLILKREVELPLGVWVGLSMGSATTDYKSNLKRLILKVRL